MIKTILLTAIVTLTINCSYAQEGLNMTEKKIKIRNKQAEISYKLQGTGDTTLLFLHGWCINSSYWNNQLNYFNSKYRVCAMDLPGFGKSTAQRENWTIEEYSKDVLAFMEDLNLNNVVLVGHSMSGDIMLHLALLGSTRVIGLIGVENFKVIDVEFSPEQMEQMTSFFPLLQSDFKNSVAIYADNMLFHTETNDDIKQQVKTDLAASNATIAYNSFMNQMSFSQQEPKLLEKLSYKLNLINSNYFPTNKAGLESRCKNGFNLKEIKGSGHFPMIEKPNELNYLIEGILLDGII